MTQQSRASILIAMKKGIFIGFLIFLVFWGCVFVTVYFLSRGLPSLKLIERYKPPLATEVYDRNGKLIYQFYIERRKAVPLREIPQDLINAFIALEDRKFYDHWGIYLPGILRALYVDIVKRRVAQGASTITQQLARNMFLTQKRTLKRKIKEAVLAIRIERAFSKQQILERYLNQIYFGHGVYGVEAASRFYFGKGVGELNLAECALLAAIPRSPRLYSPYRNFDRAIRRQRLILKIMRDYGFISADEYREALSTPIVLTGPEKEEVKGKAPYFLDMVRRYVVQRYGEDFLFTSGGRIYTTLDIDLQEIAESVVDSFLDLFEEKYDLHPKKSEYVRDTLNPPQYLQGALVAMDPYTGEILALVGGRDYEDSKFNRVTQMRRQPGSAFKPFVYTAAIDNGYNPSDIIMDVPLALKVPGVDELWFPENYDGKYLGPITLRKALALSRNLATAHLILELGPSVVAEYARKMGIESPVPPYPSIALGSPTLSLLEITRAYATIANLGYRVTPYFVERIEDPEGRVIEKNGPQRVQVLDSTTAYIIIDMLRSVIEEGTGRRAWMVYGLKGAMAGKTGTTNEFRDTWFIGFSPKLLAGVWVGFDSLRTITEGAVGATFALPIWATFMKEAGAVDTITDFVIPQGIAWAEVCTKTGMLATQYCPETRMEIFKVENIPMVSCTLHAASTWRREGNKFYRLEEGYLRSAP